MFLDNPTREVLTEKWTGIVGEWYDDLIWCPSQCYLNILYKGRKFVIYLRWRHKDPWSVDLVECFETFNISSVQANWHPLIVGWFRAKELTKCKNNAFKVAMELIKSGKI